MSDKLKPVSEAMRKVLALLGETPADHQAEKISRAHQTKPAKNHKLPDDPKLTPAQEIALRWQSQNWRPIARVMFLRETHCSGCGTVSTCAHWPETFIKERLQKDNSSFRYLPSRSSLSSAISLPRVRETVKLTTPFCHLCFHETQGSLPDQSQCLEDMLISQLASIVSPQSKIDQNSHISSEPRFTLENPNGLMLNTSSMDPDSLQTSSPNSPIDLAISASSSTLQGLGLLSASSDFAPSALAPPTIIPIIKAEESALAPSTLIEFKPEEI